MDFLDLLETYISHCKKSADHSSILTDLICFCLKLNNSLPTDFSSHHIEQRSWNKTSKDILSKKAFDIEVIHKNATNQILSYMIDFLVVDQWSKLQQASFLMKLLSVSSFVSTVYFFLIVIKKIGKFSLIIEWFNSNGFN